MKLTVEEGGFAYAGRRILRDVRFDLEERDVLAVLGPNGAGKTTLLKCVMNMLPWQEGRAALDGRDIRGIPRRELWRRIAYVPQAKPYSADLSVRDMLLLGRSVHLSPFAQPGGEDYRIVRDIMEELGIAQLAGQGCNSLSGGELQLALIGRALVAQPEILIMDEPESGLDFRNQLLIFDLIARLSRRISCLINTHYPDHALWTANKVLLLSGTGKALFGAAASMLTEGNLHDIFGVRVIIGKSEKQGRPYIIPY
jgi:iron complex transport system ATP-binding protein